MNPEFNPPCSTKKAGNPWLIAGFTIFSILLSDTFAISARAIPKKSNGRAIGCPWKFPPDITSSVSTNINGLSVAAFNSISTFCFTYSKVSLLAPCI